MIASRFRSTIGLLDFSMVRFTALPWDCDLNIHLNAGRYVSFMDMARVELLARMRIFSKIIRRGWRPLAGGCVVRYRQSILPFQRFDVRSRIAGWDEKWFYLEQTIERGGAVYAINTTRLVIRGPEGNIPPAEIAQLAAAGQEAASPALPEYVVRWREMEASR